MTSRRFVAVSLAFSLSCFAAGLWLVKGLWA